MTEATFFRTTALAAAAAVLSVATLTMCGETVLPHILPFGEPWLTIMNIIVWWLLIVVALHLVRWVYLGISGRGPDLSQ